MGINLQLQTSDFVDCDCESHCNGGQFFHLPHFIGFIAVNVRKSHCRVPLKHEIVW